MGAVGQGTGGWREEPTVGRFLATPWTVAYQAPRSMDFPGKVWGPTNCVLIDIPGSHI